MGAQSSKEQLHTAFQSPELLPAYEEAKAVFANFDTDGNGEISWEEFLLSVTIYEGQRYTINTDVYRFIFEVFDTDGSGSISLDEALLMFHNVHSTSRFCNCCTGNLSALEDAGLACSKCYEEMQLGLKQDGSTWDVCSKCYDGGRGPGVHCGTHGAGSVVRIEELHRALGTPAAALLSNPLAEAATDGGALGCAAAGPSGYDPHGFACLCCGEVHSVVLSYLRPELLDLHVRPVMRRSDNAGKMELQGFVCEFCAMQVCGKHSGGDSMWWDSHAAAVDSCSNPKSCGRRMRCRKGETPAAAGTLKKHKHIVKAAKERHAAHCLTCRDKMDRGLLLFSPAKQQGSQVAECGSVHRRKYALDWGEGLWSNPDVYCSAACAAAGGEKYRSFTSTGSFSRAALRAAAADSHLAHCRGCRELLLHGGMLDIAAEAEQQQRQQQRVQLKQQLEAKILEASKNEKHFVVNMSKVTDSYLVPHEQPHMMPLEDGRWLCEFCFTTVCKDCGQLGTASDDAERSLWSRPFNCGCKPDGTADGGAEFGFSREVLASRTNDLHLIHCKPCRDRIDKGVLLDKSKIAKPKAPRTIAQEQQRQRQQKEARQQGQRRQQRPGQADLTAGDWQRFGLQPPRELPHIQPQAAA
ncbi:hypothetical protein COO60DRAFT_1641618 [Scenedesmus sp. NREL 46B-D3]|nr:hypothetical protein COO60DRAFT_1641618 [Scenedesmus sp. NREL 46B-D3]